MSPASRRSRCPPSGSPESWLGARTDYRLFSAQRDLSSRIVQDSSKDWWPTASVSFDPQYVGPAGLFQPSGTWRLTLSLIQPIYDGGRRRGLRRQREADLQEDELTLERLALHGAGRGADRAGGSGVSGAGPRQCP